VVEAWSKSVGREKTQAGLNGFQVLAQRPRGGKPPETSRWPTPAVSGHRRKSDQQPGRKSGSRLGRAAGAPPAGRGSAGWSFWAAPIPARLRLRPECPGRGALWCGSGRQAARPLRSSVVDRAPPRPRPPPCRSGRRWGGPGPASPHWPAGGPPAPFVLFQDLAGWRRRGPGRLRRPGTPPRGQLLHRAPWPPPSGAGPCGPGPPAAWPLNR
jgi:hypothetical protein